MSNEHANDPLGFVRNMWGNMGFSLPGMVAPTFNVDELEKRIKDLKAVEGWLRMNLSMLQATIQGLEMQVSTLTAVKTMGAMASNAAQQVAQNAARHDMPPASPTAPEPDAVQAGADAAGALSQAAMWPWHLMQQMQEQLQQQTEAAKAQVKPESAEAAAKPAAPKRPRKTGT